MASGAGVNGAAGFLRSLSQHPGPLGHQVLCVLALPLIVHVHCCGLTGGKWCELVVFRWVVTLHISSCVCWPFVILGELSIPTPSPFRLGYRPFVIELWDLFLYSRHVSLITHVIGNYFLSHFVRCFMVTVRAQKLMILIQPDVPVFPFVVCAF